jgi:glycosyltransferase involved in cell wall biosynthesis
MFTRFSSRKGASRRAMRIGINALLVSAAQSYRNAGISHYTLNLLNALKMFGGAHEFTVFVSERGIAEQLPVSVNSSVALVNQHATSPAYRILWEQLQLAGEIRRRGLHLLHAPVNVLPARLPCPGIITLHDLAFLRFPQFFRPARRAYQQWFTPRSARRAALIIAISEHTRRDIIELLHIPEERIRVIYPVLAERFSQPCPAETVQAFRLQRHLTEPFILFLATLEPRKNLLRLLEAYRQFKRETNLPHTLVLAGAQGWFMQTLERHIHTLGLAQHVRLVGYIAEEEKTLWYHAADLFVYPSLYEGFGMPVAEALACGVPVVTSPLSSLPEVVGDDGVFGERAALTVDPYDTEALAHALQQGVTNTTLREHLRERGPARAQRFAPKPIAYQVMQAYHDATGFTQRSKE